VWKALELSEHLVPIRDSLEKCCLTESKAIQKLASPLATFMPCNLIHVCQGNLICTTKKDCPLANLKNLNLAAEVVLIPAY
jgi:hypothetical protein